MIRYDWKNNIHNIPYPFNFLSFWESLSIKMITYTNVLFCFVFQISTLFIHASELQLNMVSSYFIVFWFSLNVNLIKWNVLYYILQEPIAAVSLTTIILFLSWIKFTKMDICVYHLMWCSLLTLICVLDNTRFCKQSRDVPNIVYKETLNIEVWILVNNIILYF